MRFKVGDLVKYTHLDGAMVVAEHLGIVVRVVHRSVKVTWVDGDYSWMNANWLEKV